MSRLAVFNRLGGVRGIILQLVALLLVCAGLVWLADNAVTNLARQNIASGFGFLDERAGFGIIQTLVEYDEDSTYRRVLLVGLTNTLLAAGLGIVLASVLGFVLGIARLSSNWLIAQISAAYIELFRNVPLLLQIMFWYFGVLRNLPLPRESFEFGAGIFLNNRGLLVPSPLWNDLAGYYAVALLALLVIHIGLYRHARRYQLRTGKQRRIWYITALIGVFSIATLWGGWGAPGQWEMPALRGFNFVGGISLIPELVALVLALGLYTAAFIAEIVRAGIKSVNEGQSEAAAALGLKPAQVTRFVIIPQAMRVIIPPLTSQYLNLTKNSSLAVAIAYPDIVSIFAGTSQSQTGQAVEIIFITMLIYLILSLITSAIMNIYNQRIAFKGRSV